MRLGVVSVALDEWDADEGLALLGRLGITAIEIGCGGFDTRRNFGNPDELLLDSSARARWLAMFQRHEIDITALALHGSPLSPDPAVASEYSRQFHQACRLAGTVGVDRLTLLAGLPEGAPSDRTPCWITSAYPPEGLDVLRWQWEERVLPYWSRHADVAKQYGCRLCFEMHPGDVVYNPQSLMRLRQELGSTIGCNFDPSHLFWQGIDPIQAVTSLSTAIYHVHAKDMSVNSSVMKVTGALDPTPYDRSSDRAWNYCTVGEGHDDHFWADLGEALAKAGYDDVLSIEHEDVSVTTEIALEKACSFLRGVIGRRCTSSGTAHQLSPQAFGYQAWDPNWK